MSVLIIIIKCFEKIDKPEKSSTLVINNVEIFIPLADLIDISMKMGLSVGAETMAGPLKVGGAFVQRGTKSSIEILDVKVEGSNTYNYLSGYALYPYAIQEELSAFGGLQAGFFLSGSGEVEGESYDFESDDIGLDYGLLLGVDYMFDTNMGIRASYYLGLADVVKDLDSDSNFTNTGIGISLLFKIYLMVSTNFIITSNG